MYKRFFLAGCLCLMLLTIGCDKYSDSPGYFSNFTAGGDADYYALSGKAYVTDTLPFLYFASSDSTKINIRGNLKGVSGNVEIVRVDANGENVIVSAKDKKTDIDINLLLESGEGRLEFRGNEVNFKFDLSIENIDREKVEYLSADSRNEEEQIVNEQIAGEQSGEKSLSDTNSNHVNQDTVLQEITVTYSNNDSVVLNTEISEDSKLIISVSVNVSNADDNKNASFNGFELAYKTESGKTIEVLKCDEKAFAVGDYEWQDNLNGEVELPKGKNELIFRNRKDNNCKIVLDISVSKVE